MLPNQIGQNHVLQSKSKVGLVVSVLGHRLIEVHSWKGNRDLDAQDFAPQGPDQSFHDLEHVLLRDETHLQVDLGELRLAVQPQILVAEAFDDLEIPIEPGHHEQLLVELRAFRQRVKLPRIESRRHQKIARTTGGVPTHERGLQLQKSATDQKGAGQRVHFRADDQGFLQLRPAQVQVSVRQALFFGGVDAVFDHKRERLRAVEYL